MQDEAARLLKAIKNLETSYFKVALLALLNTGMRPEEMLALCKADFIEGEELLFQVTGSLSDRSNQRNDYVKTDSSRRSTPIDDYTAKVTKEWIQTKERQLKEIGLKPTLEMPIASNSLDHCTYQKFKNDWDDFTAKIGLKNVRPYALRHTFATLNLANGENIKTLSVILGHKSSAYMLDLYAGYVP